MRPLTSIIAAATLGTKPETFRVADWKQKTLLMAATACDLTRRSANEVDRGRGVQSWAADGGCRKDPAAFPSGSDNDTLPHLLPREQSMRILSVLVATAALFAVTAPAAAASRADWDACKGDDPDPPTTTGASCTSYKGITTAPSPTFSEAIRLDPRLASAYNNRGNAYGAPGNTGRAIADFDEAIRLEPKYAVAYNNRGSTYLSQGRIAPAIADFDEAIRLDPKFVFAYVDRGNAYRARGDNDRAIADFSEAIRLEPKFADAYLNRGLAYLYSGTLDKALADVSEASELDPQDAYKALWADIVAARNNAPSHLSQASTRIDMTPWPAPIVRSFLGRMPPEAVLAAADDPDAKKKNHQVCEANLYGGELALRLNAKDEAVRLFRLAASGCAKDVNEWFAANAELKALGETP
jgi:lipoprotein NlpI